MTRRLLPFLLVACLVISCRTTNVSAPEGCRLSADDATDFATAYLSNEGLDWGSPVRIAFSSTRWRLLYDTPEGEDTRALVVDCATGLVSRG